MAQTGRVLKVLLKLGLGLFLVALIVVSLFRRDWFVMYVIESLELACSPQFWLSRHSDCRYDPWRLPLVAKLVAGERRPGGLI